MEAMLGLDIGNKSVKAVLLSKDKEIIDWVYLDNLGIIKTLKQAFSKLDRKGVRVIEVGVCGAGREFASRLLNADVTRTEIISFYRGCLDYLKKDSFTAFDIGGEDAKIIAIEKNLIKDFVMNSICSANLGVYLENVAYRLNIKIEDFGKIALQSSNPLSIASKCGVFGISSCVSLLNQGAKIEDILSGVAKSLVRNYLSMYRKSLIPPFIFAGGVALNKAVHYWLEKELNHEVHIPLNPLILSAVGIATLTQDCPVKEEFSLDDFLKREQATQIFTCKECENNCQITKLTEDKKTKAHFGSRCGRYG